MGGGTIVVYHQHLLVIERRGSSAINQLRFLFGDRGRCVCRVEGEMYYELATLAHTLAKCLNGAAMHLDELLSEREADAKTFTLTFARLKLEKWLKNM